MLRDPDWFSYVYSAILIAAATMSIDWQHIRSELRERKRTQGLTDREERVLAEAEAAIERGEPWMSQSGPEPEATPTASK